jgi:hypothetical protein
MVKNRAKIVIYHKIKSKYREKFTNQGLIGLINKPFWGCPPPPFCATRWRVPSAKSGAMGKAKEGFS